MAENEGDGGTADNKELVESIGNLVRSNVETQRSIGALVANAASGPKTVAPESPPPKVWTRVELDEQVAASRITQAGADEILMRQQTDSITDRVVERVTENLSGKLGGDNIATEIDRYIALIPDLQKADSSDRQKVQAAYQRLAQRGHSTSTDVDTARLELTALENVYGDIKALEASRDKGRRETSQETGGSGGGDADAGPNTSDGLPADMPAAQRRFYIDLIAKKIHTVESAAKEWQGKHRDAGVTKRAGGAWLMALGGGMSAATPARRRALSAPALVRSESSYTTLDRVKRSEAPGRPKRQTPGTFVTDLAELGKCICLCLKCLRSFDHKAYGYERAARPPLSGGVISHCDGCFERNAMCRMFLLQGVR